MKSIFITIALLTIVSLTSKAQNSDTVAKTTAAFTTFVKFDKPPVPPQGHMMTFNQYLSSNIRYPAIAFENHTQGQLSLTFTIEADGSVTNAIISKSLSKETDAEALRAMSNCPKWTAASKNGQPVSCRITVPITFKISGNTASVIAGR
jgi:TonB family protein